MRLKTVIYGLGAGLLLKLIIELIEGGLPDFSTSTGSSTALLDIPVCQNRGGRGG